MYNHWYNPILNTYLYTADGIVGPYKGYMKETNIERYPHMFFPYIVFLFQTIESIINKVPFQIIPQYTMKARSLTIGKEQLTEIVLRLAKSGKLDDGSILVPFKIGDIPTVKDCAQTKKRKREEAYKKNELVWNSYRIVVWTRKICENGLF